MDSVNRSQALLAAMKIIVSAASKATGHGLELLFDAYNHLHRQLDGTTVSKPRLPKPVFTYDTRSQMMRT